MKRFFQNIFTTELTLRRCFPQRVLDAIEGRIKESEQQHGGQVCFVVETTLHIYHLMRGATSRERALEQFGRLQVWDTEHNNGVLLYVLLSERRIEIIADRGLMKFVAQETWDQICRTVLAKFRDGQFQEGVEGAIAAITPLLRDNFPHSDRGKNELSDRPVVI